MNNIKFYIRPSKKHLPNLLTLLASVLVSVLLTFVVIRSPLLFGIFSLLTGLLVGLFYITWFISVQKNLPFGEPAGQTYARLGYRFRWWFVAHSVAPVCFAGLIGGALLIMFGRDPLAIALFTGFSAPSFYCWIGAFSSLTITSRGEVRHPSGFNLMPQTFTFVQNTAFLG